MSRFLCTHQKIPSSRTGLKADLYIHVDHTPNGTIESVRFSEKGRDGFTLDRILHACGDATTDILKEIQGGT